MYDTAALGSMLPSPERGLCRGCELMILATAVGAVLGLAWRRPPAVPAAADDEVAGTGGAVARGERWPASVSADKQRYAGSCGVPVRCALYRRPQLAWLHGAVLPERQLSASMPARADSIRGAFAVSAIMLALGHRAIVSRCWLAG